MRRKIYDSLLRWKDSSDRKPLVLEGARQVGKTYILKEFGQREYDNLVYINCQKDKFMSTMFDEDFNINRILTNLSAYTSQTINAGHTLIFFDEAQDAPHCMESLKYFCEDAPEHHVVVAGSLLGLVDHKKESYPVGKVNTLQLFPMSFEEFLWANGKEMLSNQLNVCAWDVLKTMDDQLQELLRLYYYVGGMPAAVLSYTTEGNLQKIRNIQNEILRNYNNDFSKHAGDETQRIRMVWKSLPAQLAKENKKFQYSAIKKGGRAKEFEKAIQWLVDAGLAHKIHRCLDPTLPLSYYEDDSAFKLFLLDVGLLGALSQMPAKQMLAQNNVFEEAKGAFTENYVLQQLKTIQNLGIYYFSKDNSSQEIDFLIQKDDAVIPVEVKAEENVRSRSLSGFIKDDYASKNLKGLRCSMKPYIDQEWMENIPLYAVSAFIANNRKSQSTPTSMLDRKKIESEGVIAFNHYINYCSRLDPHVNQRDKEPIWDGELHIYNSPSLTNANHSGDVIRLQIKATMDFSSNAYAKYAVPTTELATYQKNGGVLFIVVHVARTGNKCFYKALTPVLIAQLLENATSQKTVTITLGPMPEREVDFETTMFDFAADCRAQHSFSSSSYISIHDIAKAKDFNITLNAHGEAYNELEMLELITAKPRQMYYKKNIDGTTVQIPIKEGEARLFAQSDAELSVSVDGTTYFDKIKLEIGDGKHNLRIGNCLKVFHLKEENHVQGKMKVQYRSIFESKTLSDRIADLRFILAVDQHKYFSIGGIRFQFDVELNDRDSQAQQLAMLKDLKQVLDILHVRTELLIDDIKTKERSNIKALIAAILHGDTIYPDRTPDTPLVNITLANLKLLFITEKQENGSWSLRDFYGDMELLSAQDDDNRLFHLPPCAMLKPDEILQISNINYPMIVEAYERCYHMGNLPLEMVNRNLLNFLLAYDKLTQKDDVMLTSITDLANWIYTKETDLEQKQLHKLNIMQIIKRKRQYTEEELEDLYVILDSTKDDQLKFAVYLLIGEKASATRYFRRIDKYAQEEIKQQPIWHFME